MQRPLGRFAIFAVPVLAALAAAEEPVELYPCPAVVRLGKMDESGTITRPRTPREYAANMKRYCDYAVLGRFVSITDRRYDTLYVPAGTQRRQQGAAYRGPLQSAPQLSVLGPRGAGHCRGIAGEAGVAETSLRCRLRGRRPFRLAARLPLQGAKADVLAVGHAWPLHLGGALVGIVLGLRHVFA